MNARENEHGHEGPHVVPVSLLLTVFGTLIALTVVTVVTARIDLGALDVTVAIGIASVKGVLVALYFMHLRWDRPFHGVLLVAALLFVALFVSLTLLDSGATAPEIESFRTSPAGN